MPKLCLNMIVRNEADKIERCLNSVAPYIDCWSITDTGSTDDTPATIIAFFGALGIPGHIHSAPFQNFEQARNAALFNARTDPLDWDYAFLVDADMELVVEDKNFKDKLFGLAHDVVQKAGGITYHNTRFVSRQATGNYRGVTHEYIDIASSGVIGGVYFVDHADGSNRKDKFIRDIRLLKAGLKAEPSNARYWFYLAQSYRDAGKPDKAAKAYLKRIELGGWDEEIWNARFNYAHALKDCGDEGGFIRELLASYNYRPSRAEPLYDLAKHYREKGMNYACLAIAEEGLRIPYPNDKLFVSDYAYLTGLREEFSIAAYYDASRRDRGFAMCNAVSLDRAGTDWSREQARMNLFHYIQPLSVSLPSFSARHIPFTAPDGYVATNPSIATVGGKIHAVVRTVNYTMDEQGRYLIKGTNGECNSTNPIHTRNFLLGVKDNFEVEHSKEMLSPADWQPPAFNLVVGFEDMRLFSFGDELWVNACVREQNPQGWCEQFIAKIDPGNPCRLTNWGPMLPLTRHHEKNWMPWPDADIEFVYRLGSRVDVNGKFVTEEPTSLVLDRISGGSQVIPFMCGWLAVVHEARHRPGDNKRYYQHRFVWFDANKKFQKISLPFVFHDRVIEFAAGLAWHPDGKRVMVSYGREDKEAWVATVDAGELTHFVWGL